jgi:hypothetical protein
MGPELKPSRAEGDDERVEWPRLRGRHKRTLEAIFQNPTASDLEWREVKSLFEALGADIGRTSGSSRTIALGEVKFVCHEPHNPAILPKGMVRRVRQFLESVGVELQ